MSAEQPIQRDFCFVSYARADERFALRLAEDLRLRGVAIWIDQLNIRTSEHWDRAIERAIRGCSSVLVILSPRAVLSDNVADEISLAVDGAKTIIYDVFNMDLRGRGAPGDSVPYTTPGSTTTSAKMCRLPCSAIAFRDHEQVFLIGHSMGGLISYCVAGSTMREQVAAVIRIGLTLPFRARVVLLALSGPFSTRRASQGDSTAIRPFRFVRLARTCASACRSGTAGCAVPAAPLEAQAAWSTNPQENLAASSSTRAWAWRSASSAWGPRPRSRATTGSSTTAWRSSSPKAPLGDRRDARRLARRVRRPVFDRSRSTDKTYRDFRWATSTW